LSGGVIALFNIDSSVGGIDKREARPGGGDSDGGGDTDRGGGEMEEGKILMGEKI